MTNEIVDEIVRLYEKGKDLGSNSFSSEKGLAKIIKKELSRNKDIHVSQLNSQDYGEIEQQITNNTNENGKQNYSLELRTDSLKELSLIAGYIDGLNTYYEMQDWEIGIPDMLSNSMFEERGSERIRFKYSVDFDKNHDKGVIKVCGSYVLIKELVSNYKKYNPNSKIEVKELSSNQKVQ